MTSDKLVTEEMVKAGLAAARKVGLQDAPVTIIYLAMQSATLSQSTDRVRELEAENERLRERMSDMMPIAGGNPMKPSNMRGGSASSSALNNRRDTDNG